MNATREIKRTGMDRVRGTVEIVQEGTRKFVVERSDLNGVYDRIEGLTTFKKAIAEFKCYAG